MSDRVVTVILGGGRGTRLYPLTAVRAKPAVPLGGKYRLIDIPVSNAINSGFRTVYVLTQFNSASLNRHVSRTYQFDSFSRGFVEVLAAEQTDHAGSDWYQGTADAVRKQLHHFDLPEFDHVLILAGDHLYRMDYRQMLQRHLDAGADVTVATIPVDRAGCTGFGIMGVDGRGQIRAFTEKPAPDADISHLAAPDALAAEWGLQDKRYMASMGVYVFSRKALRDGLTLDGALDFGRDILPAMTATHTVVAHRFQGYWGDIGTTDAFFEANLALCEADPIFRFWDAEMPIYTRRRFLPASKIQGSSLNRCIVAEGSIIEHATLTRCVVGLRSRIRAGVQASNAVIMGADYFESDADRQCNLAEGRIHVGIAEGCVLDRVIVDKNARIGAGSVLRGDPSLPDQHGDGWSHVDGIVVIQKNATIPPGSRIGAV